MSLLPSRITVGSTISVQAVPENSAVPPIGELPTPDTSRSNVEVRPAQSDTLLLRESIGSAILEEKLNQGTTGEFIDLNPCPNSKGKEYGLSTDRPVFLASLDAFSRFVPSRTASGPLSRAPFIKSIDENLELYEFENSLLKSDYDFLMNELKSRNSEIFARLESALQDKEAKIEQSIKLLSEISIEAQQISRDLDFVSPGGTFSEMRDSYVNNFNFKFDESRPTLVSQPESPNATSTSEIAKLQNAIDSVGAGGRAENDLLARLLIDGTCYSYARSVATVGDSYESLDYFERTIACCKVLSKIMARTFSAAKFKDSNAAPEFGGNRPRLPKTISRGSQQGYIFEFNEVRYSEDIPSEILSERTSGPPTLQQAPRTRLAALENLQELENSTTASKKNHNYDSIISPALQGAKSTIESLRLAGDEFEKSKNFLQYLIAAGFENERCSPQDVLLLVFKTIIDSFPTYRTALNRESTPDKNEMVDALVMVMGRNPFTTLGVKTWEGALYRSVILSSIIDETYAFGVSDAELFESTTSSKVVVNDGEERVIRSNSGTSSTGAGAVSSTSAATSRFWFPLQKRGMIPPAFSESIREYLQTLDEEINSSLGDSVNLDKPESATMFTYDFITSLVNNLGETPGAAAAHVPNNSAIIGITEVDFDPAGFDDNPSNGNGTGYQGISYFSDVYESLSKYGESSSTIKSSIKGLYEKLLALFEDEYKTSIDENSFSNELGKKEIFDLIYECVSSCLQWILSPTVSSVLEASERSPTLDSPELGQNNTVGPGGTSIGPTLDSPELGQNNTVGPGGTSIGTGLYIFSGRLSILSNNPRIQYELYESVRLMSLLKDLIDFDGSLSVFLTNSIDRNYVREIRDLQDQSGLSVSTYGFENDVTESSFYKAKDDLYSVVGLLQDYSESMKLLANAQSLASIIRTSVRRLELISSRAASVKEGLTDLTEPQKRDIFTCMSPASVSSALLKYQNRKLDESLGFETSYEKNRSTLDASAARWFFKQFPIDDYERSRIVFWGLPQGFVDSLTRHARLLDSGTYLLVEADSEENNFPKYFEAAAFIKPVQFSRVTYETQLAKFHPYLHVVQNDAIDESDNQNTIRRKFKYFVFSSQSGRWEEINVDSSFEISTALGLSGRDLFEVIDSHINSSILTSVVKAFTGLHIEADTLGTYEKSMSREEANRVLQIISSDTAGIVPRGSMIASEFLSVNSGGFFESIPYSKLSGDASDKTNPSDHSLLLKFLDTRLFNVSSLAREIVIPSPFERVYCALFNTDVDIAESIYDARADGSSDAREDQEGDRGAKFLSISQLLIKAVR